MDDAAFVEKQYPQILHTAFLLTGDRADAEDLAQETFLQVLDKWEQFHGQSSRKTWLYSILLNVHKSRLRSARRTWLRVLRWFDSTDSPRQRAPDELIAGREWQQSLWSAVAQLPAAQRDAIVLRFSEDLALGEIAEIMHCPLGTVKSRIHLALAKLSQDSKLKALNRTKRPTDQLESCPKTILDPYL